MEISFTIGMLGKWKSVPTDALYLIKPYFGQPALPVDGRASSLSGNLKSTHNHCKRYTNVETLPYPFCKKKVPRLHGALLQSGE